MADGVTAFAAKIRHGVVAQIGAKREVAVRSIDEVTNVNANGEGKYQIDDEAETTQANDVADGIFQWYLFAQIVDDGNAGDEHHPDAN